MNGWVDCRVRPGPRFRGPEPGPRPKFWVGAPTPTPIAEKSQPRPRPREIEFASPDPDPEACCEPRPRPRFSAFSKTPILAPKFQIFRFCSIFLPQIYNYFLGFEKQLYDSAENSSLRNTIRDMNHQNCILLPKFVGCSPDFSPDENFRQPRPRPRASSASPDPDPDPGLGKLPAPTPTPKSKSEKI